MTHTDEALPETVTKTILPPVYKCKVCARAYNDLDEAGVCSTRTWPGLPVVGRYYVVPKELHSGVYRCDSVEPYVETTTVNHRTGEKKPTGRPSGTCTMQATFTVLGNPWQDRQTQLYHHGECRSSFLSRATRAALEARLRPLREKEAELAKDLDRKRVQIAQIEDVLGVLRLKPGEA